MRSDRLLEFGQPHKRRLQHHRGQGVVAAEGEQIPVVVAHAPAAEHGGPPVGHGRQARAAGVADPANVDVRPLRDIELFDREADRPPQPPDHLLQKLDVARPAEEVGRSDHEQGAGDRVPRVDGGDQRLEHDRGATDAPEDDPVAVNRFNMVGMAVERHVGIPHRRRRWLDRDRAIGGPLALPRPPPGDLRGGGRAEVFPGPFEAEKRRHEGVTVHRRRRDRYDVVRRLEDKAAGRIDAHDLGPGEFPAGGRLERLEQHGLLGPAIAREREVPAAATGLLPGGKGPALGVSQAPMLLHRDVALGVEASIEQDPPVALPRLRARPERRLRQPGVPEGAGGEGWAEVPRVQVGEQPHLGLVPGHDEPRPGLGGRSGNRDQHHAD